MAFNILEPPVFAAIAPKVIKKIIVKPYNKYSMPFNGANNTTKSGKTPPTINDAPDAKLLVLGLLEIGRAHV